MKNKSLVQIINEKCTHKNAHEFIKEYEEGNILPLRFLRLFTYLATEYPFPLDEKYKKIVDILIKNKLIPRVD